MDYYTQAVSECAEQGKALSQMMANNGVFEALYLYHRPSEPGRPGRLYLVRDSALIPPHVSLVTGEGLRSNVPFENYFQWVYERARRAPIMPIEVEE